jgi:peptidoglycan hydrolase-like protein with peptidoglycan-binding domain
VRSVQYNLGARNHKVTVDGEFGPKTREAVEAFQRSAGLTCDGIVGSQTWPALVVTVQEGSTGDAVKGVQSQAQFRIQADDHAPDFPIDGIFGPRTAAYVRGFQGAVGIPADGIVGPVTWSHLVNEELAG